MIRILALGAAVCVMSGVGHLRRAGELRRTTHYEFEDTKDVGIISHNIASHTQIKPLNMVARKSIFIKPVESEPDEVELLVVPLQALIDGALFIPGKNFRLCSDTDALALPEFDIHNLVVNNHSIPVGYFAN